MATSNWIEMDDRTSYQINDDGSAFVSSTDEVGAADARLIAESLGHRLGGTFRPSFDWTPAENGTAVATFVRVVA